MANDWITELEAELEPARPKYTRKDMAEAVLRAMMSTGDGKGSVAQAVALADAILLELERVKD